jgi:CheY-like chemotaxis protein
MPTILLVDDDALVQNVTRELLEFLGYTVLSAVTGKQAIRLIQEKKDVIGLVLLDLSLPDLNGVELIPIFKGINSKIPIIVCTGSLFEDDDADTFAQSNIRAILQKPFDFDLLKDTLLKLFPPTKP